MFRISTAFAAVAAFAVLATTQYASAQISQNPYYFGMNVQLVYSTTGPSLQVVSVTPGGPAAQAGLEPGDQIQAVNGRGFSGAGNSFRAVEMMNSYVIANGNGGIAPAQSGIGTLVNPSPRPFANMTVIDIRTGNYVMVAVNPTRQYGGGGGGGIVPSQSGSKKNGGK